MNVQNTAPNTDTPPAIPDEENIRALRLYRSPRVGPKNFKLLAERHDGDYDACMESLVARARETGLRDYEPCSLDSARAEYERGRALGAELITQNHPFYPEPMHVVTGAPPLFWAKGIIPFLNSPQIAIVGARNASALGRRFTSYLARDLCLAGFTVTSGLARGIDTEAHIAAINSRTIAVVAGGLDIHYPRENAKLQEEIGDHGCLVSEQPPGFQPQARHFPQRNRIISALAHGVVVIEATERSGTMITANEAVNIGRDVFAVPGHPLEPRAAGTNALIREGACLLRTVDDILDVIGKPEPHIIEENGELRQPLREAPKHREPGSQEPVTTTTLEHAILVLLGAEAVSEAWLADQMDEPVAALMAGLSELELAGKIARSYDGKITRL